MSHISPLCPQYLADISPISPQVDRVEAHAYEEYSEYGNDDAYGQLTLKS